MPGSGGEPGFPDCHGITGVNNQYSIVNCDCVASIFWILCFVFPHPIKFVKPQPVSLVSGEKRKAIPPEMKCKISAQL